MKKIIPVITLLIMLICLASCSDNNVNSSASSTTGETENATSEDQLPEVEASEVPTPSPTEEGDIDDYYIQILDATQDVDSDGNSVLIVSLKYTNNNNETNSFSSSVTIFAYQNEEMLNQAFMGDRDEYNINGFIEDVEPGDTIDVDIAFILADEESPVKVDINQIISDNSINLTKTFELD